MEIDLNKMFAVKRDGAPHLIMYGESGTHQLKSHEAFAAWAMLWNTQTDAVREAAIAGSMFGWSVPAAKAAVDHMLNRRHAP